MKKTILAPLGLAIALAFSAPMFAPVSADAATMTKTADKTMMKKAPMKKKAHHHKKMAPKKKGAPAMKKDDTKS